MMQGRLPGAALECVERFAPERPDGTHDLSFYPFFFFFGIPARVPTICGGGAPTMVNETGCKGCGPTAVLTEAVMVKVSVMLAPGLLRMSMGTVTDFCPAGTVTLCGMLATVPTPLGPVKRMITVVALSGG